MQILQAIDALIQLPPGQWEEKIRGVPRTHSHYPTGTGQPGEHFQATIGLDKRKSRQKGAGRTLGHLSFVKGYGQRVTQPKDQKKKEGDCQNAGVSKCNCNDCYI